MNPNTDKSRAPEATPGSKSDAKDELKSLPLLELEKTSGVVARRPQSGRGAETADPLWAERA